MPAITVIIPIYNSDDYIGNCIRSLQNQTFADFEAICVDDASTTNALEIAKSAAGDDARFVFIEQQQNQGPSAARNVGLDRAQGKYIAFLDSDDEFVPGAFEKLYTLAETHDLDLIDFCSKSIYESEEIKGIWYERHDVHTPLEGVVRGTELFTHYQKRYEYHCALCLHFFKRALLDEGPLRLREGIIHEDELFAPHLHIRAQRAMLLNEQIYLRLVHAGSLVTAPRGIYNVSCLFSVIQELEAWLYQNARSYDASFIDAFASRIWELRSILAEDILRCSAEELVTFQDELSDEDYAAFTLNGIQMAASLEAMRKKKSWRIANAISVAAHRVRGIPL